MQRWKSGTLSQEQTLMLPTDGYLHALSISPGLEAVVVAGGLLMGSWAGSSPLRYAMNHKVSEVDR